MDAGFRMKILLNQDFKQTFVGLPTNICLVTAIKEANQGFTRKMEPYVMRSYDVDCEDIVDLSDASGRRAADVEESVLSAGWFSRIAAGTKPPQWRLVESLVAKGAAGALVPSYAPEALAADRNLVLWRWGQGLPHKVEVFDPSGRASEESAVLGLSPLARDREASSRRRKLVI